jgi:putative ABC transport system permease protein
MLAAAHVIASLLYGVSATDPRIVTGVVALLLVVAGIASLIRAKRATSIDPLVALCGESMVLNLRGVALRNGIPF